MVEVTGCFQVEDDDTFELVIPREEVVGNCTPGSELVGSERENQHSTQALMKYWYESSHSLTGPGRCWRVDVEVSAEDLSHRSHRLPAPRLELVCIQLTAE